MTAVALRQVDLEPVAATLSREAVLARYQRLRAINMRINSELMNYLSADAILQQAQRLGLAHGRTLILDSEDEINFALDLAIYTAPSGRTRAIDRYARSAQLAPDSDEARVLEAMRRARFAIVVVERRHQAAGLIVTDVARGDELWLVDQGLERSMSDGSALATRLYMPDGFAMTAGVLVPLDAVLLSDAISALPRFVRKAPRQSIDDRRFAETLYRVALDDGVMDRVGFQNVVGEPG
jgi:hypothetical protein